MNKLNIIYFHGVYNWKCQSFFHSTRTKKQAKHLCAQQALSSFVQFRDANDGTFVNALANNPMVRIKSRL